MDGMGETYKAMLEDIGGVEVRTVPYFKHRSSQFLFTATETAASRNCSARQVRLRLLIVLLIMVISYYAYYVWLRSIPETTCTT